MVEKKYVGNLTNFDGVIKGLPQREYETGKNIFRKIKSCMNEEKIKEYMLPFALFSLEYNDDNPKNPENVVFGHIGLITNPKKISLEYLIDKPNHPDDPPCSNIAISGGVGGAYSVNFYRSNIKDKNNVVHGFGPDEYDTKEIPCFKEDRLTTYFTYKAALISLSKILQSKPDAIEKVIFDKKYGVDLELWRNFKNKQKEEVRTRR